MTPAGRSGFSEGMAVAVASVVLISGLFGLMAWRVTTQQASPPDETGMDRKAAEEVAERLREEVSGLKEQLRESEARRLASVAATEEVGRAQKRVRELAAETGQLQARVAELEEKNMALEQELEGATMATAVAVSPPPEVLPAATGDGHSVSTKVLHNVRVVDANKDLEYVVLDAGKKDGVRVGMVFHVMDGNQVVATLRAADVRDDLTGSTVEGVAHGRYPQPSDRVILGQSSDK